MTSKIKRSLIVLLSVVLTLMLFFTFEAVKTKADGNNVENLAMVPGAQIRLAESNTSDDSGIKFTANLPKSYYDNIVNANAGTPVFFGMEISANGVPKDYCKYVSDNSDYEDYAKVDFAGENSITYSVSILYNEAQLKSDLANSSKFNPNYDANKSKEENAEAYSDDLVASYLKQAYSKDLTAKAYYKVGINGEKVYGDNPVTRSMWSVAYYAYSAHDENVFDGDNFLLSKYLDTSKTTEVESAFIQADGEIVGYDDIAETSSAYIGTEKVSIVKNDNKYYISSIDALKSYALKDKVDISIVNKTTAELKTLSCMYVTMAIDEVSDFTVFNLDQETTVNDITVGEVIGGYYVLTKDIDANGTNMGLTHTKINAGLDPSGALRYANENGVLKVGFTGDFDGLGHKISNFVPSQGGLFGRLAGGTNISGIFFENLKVTDSTYAIAYHSDSTQQASGITNNDDEYEYFGMTLKERNATYQSTEYASIYNCYFDLSSDTTSAGGVLLHNDIYDANTVVGNIVIDASACTLSGNYSLFFKDGGSAYGYGFSGEKIIIINPDGCVVKGTSNIYGSNQSKSDGSSKDWFYVYSTYADMLAKFKTELDTPILAQNPDVTHFNVATDFWDETELANGKLYFIGSKSYIANKYKNAYASTIALKDAEENIIDSISTFVVSEYTIVSGTTAIDASSISNVVSSNSNVVTIADGKVKVISATQGEYTISFDVSFTGLDGNSASTSVTVDVVVVGKPVVEIATQAIYDASANKIYYEDSNGAKKTLIADADTTIKYTDVALSVNSFSYMYKDAVVVSNENATTIGGATKYIKGQLYQINPRFINGATETKITINYDHVYTSYSNLLTFTVENTDTNYKFTKILPVTAVIDDGAELKQIFNKPDNTAPSWYQGLSTYGNITKGVYVLNSNIDAKATGFTFDNSYLNFFDGLLDGLGYTISNLDVSGTESAPGNGLFSGSTRDSVIQNIAFTNVTANYGSVFFGNSAEASPYYGTYADNLWGGSVDKNMYRKQVGIADDDTTTNISTILSNVWRVYDAGGLNCGIRAALQNVYVQVSPSTKRLMGVISNDMPNLKDQVRAHNFVVEYLPTQLYDSSEGANDGALPYGYTYSEGLYGVLFGGAYTHSLATSVNPTPARTYFEPTDALSFNSLKLYNSYADNVNVISTVGLVSCKTGSILGTDATTDANNPYKFAGVNNRGLIKAYASRTEFNSAYATVWAFDIVGNGTVYKYWNKDATNGIVWITK